MKKSRMVAEGSFPHRLRKARQQKGWSQSDLARKIWGTEVNSQGYTVAKNRGRISYYEDGNGDPTPENLTLIAKALGVSEVDLAPELVSEIDKKYQAVSMTMAQGQPGRVHLQVNVLTSLEVASKVIALLSDEGITKPVRPKAR